MPRWSPDGAELYYVTGNGTLVAVSVKRNGAALQVKAPVTLFPLRGPLNNVSKNGRFLSFTNFNQGGVRGGRGAALLPDHIVVLFNWAAAPRAGTRGK